MLRAVVLASELHVDDGLAFAFQATQGKASCLGLADEAGAERGTCSGGDDREIPDQEASGVSSHGREGGESRRQEVQGAGASR
ncbi:MAG: hypothetical protein ABIQ33_01830 [Caldimonas sp.]